MSLRDSLFERRSPLAGWFLLMELIALLGLVGFWIEVFNRPHSMTEVRIGCGAALTLLFPASNLLLYQKRRLAVVGFILCFLALAGLLLPTL